MSANQAALMILILIIIMIAVIFAAGELYGIAQALQH